MAYQDLCNSLAQLLVSEGICRMAGDAGTTPVVYAEEPDGIPLPSVARAEGTDTRTTVHIWEQNTLAPSKDKEGRFTTRPVVQVDVQSDALINGVLSPVEGKRTIERIAQLLDGASYFQAGEMQVVFSQRFIGPQRSPWRGDEETAGYGWRVSFFMTVYRSEFAA